MSDANEVNPEIAGDYTGLDGAFDTVLCLNVLERVEDPAAAVAAMARTLKPGGVLVALVPQCPSLYGTIDQTLGNRRRFHRRELKALLEAHGLKVERWYQLNRVGAPLWGLSSRILRHGKLSKLTLKLFDKTVWLWRRVDVLLPWRGLTLVAVARRTG